MNLLVTLQEFNNEYVVSSRIIAKETDKRHDHVLRDIREKLETHEFGESYYLSSQNKKLPEYLLPKDSFILLMMNYEGFNDFKRAYIRKFNAMGKQLEDNKHLLPTTYESALEQLLAQVKRNNQLQLQQEQDKPLIEFANNVKKAINNITVKEFANILCDDNFHIGQKRLFDWLRLYKYIDKTNKPYQQYLERDYFRLDYREYKRDNSVLTYSVTLITPKGQIYFANKLKEVE